MRTKTGFIMVLTVFLLMIILTGGLFAENKTALVIGNSSYKHFPVLSQPWREAAAMKASLERLGFEVVYVVDGSYERMLLAVDQFRAKLRERGGTAFFHYGGHGVQVGGENYLLPVDKAIPSELYVRSRAVPASDIVHTMTDAGSTTNIVVLDACRDNPLPVESRSAARGLARLDAPVNSIVVYSAAAGKTAQDGIFTPTLIKYMESPGLSFMEVIRKTRQEVYEKTGRKQLPGSYEQLFEPIYLAGTAGGTETSRQSGFTVEENYGNIKITTVTEGTLYLNGTRQGNVSAGATANLTDLSTGSHSLEMRYTDGEKETKTVTVQKDRTASLAFTYKPASKTGEYKIGDRGPAGGWIFYDKGSYSDGWRYLEAAPKETEWNNKEWGVYGEVISGADGKAVGTGKQNTADIIASQGTGSTYAGQLCDGLSHGGYNDWFLPSKDELDLMYTNLHKRGIGGFAGSFYWSSSKSSRDFAWVQNSNAVNPYLAKKDDNYRVRAVRGF